MNHRERLAADKIKHGPPPEYDDNLMLLLQRINSGQVEPSQYVAHVEAGDVQIVDLTKGATPCGCKS